jgi:hypothetical protein
MSITLSVHAGIAAHPKVAAPQPAMQIQQDGPTAVTWRIYDAAASLNTRTHTAYAAGRVHLGADHSQEQLNAAYATAEAEARTALDEVRQMVGAS